MTFDIQVQGVGETIKFIRLESEKRATEFMGKMAMEAFTGVVKRSPVDLGRFRANWGVSIGSPSRSSSLGFDKQSFGSNPGSATQIAAMQTVAGITKKTRAIWINNNLPYATALDQGHSSQNRTGIVAPTLKDLTRMLT